MKQIQFKGIALFAAVIGSGTFAGFAQNYPPPQNQYDQPSQSSRESGFHFPIGLDFTQGGLHTIRKLEDAYTANWTAQYGSIYQRHSVVPLGLTFSPYYEWAKTGLGFGADLGPTLFAGDSLHPGYNHGYESTFSAIVPLGADIRYTFLRDEPISPYMRAGIKYPFAAGHNIHGYQPGPFGAVGVEFWRHQPIGISFEVGYEASQVKIDSITGPTKTTYGGFTAGFAVLF